MSNLIALVLTIMLVIGFIGIASSSTHLLGLRRYDRERKEAARERLGNRVARRREKRKDSVDSQVRL